jgi:membrane associated rhomboid family serine protease
LVNYALILVNVLVFAYMLTLSQAVPADLRQAVAEFVELRDGTCYGFEPAPTEVDRFFCDWSFQPREFFDTLQGESRTGDGRDWAVLASIVTSVFIHAGWLHILGNMIFLWVFGDNVEDRFGHVAYLGFYLASGIVASLAQASIDPSSVVPVVGASGAVAGVLGAYLVWFPKATISVVIPFFVLIFIPLPVPAIVMIGLWFLQNLLAGYATIGSAGTPDAGVAFFAHIGGFIFGFALVLLLFRNLRAARRAPPPAW